MADTPFAAEFRALLDKHGITAPRFAHNARAFDPVKPQVLYSGPVYDQDELVAATSALCEGKWSVAGENVHRFEAEFSRYLNQAESVMVNSGSSADLLMLAACKAHYGWKDGDGVIVSPCGFPTTISAITLNGLVPVFVDIEWETLNASNDAIEAVLEGYPKDNRAAQGVMSVISPEAHRMITKEGVTFSYWDTKTGTMGPERFYPWRPTIRAILVSPVLGNPPDIDRLVALSERYGVKLLMDGCDSLGTTWRGKHLAEYATATTCSLFPSHHISTLQGGMMSSNDRELIRVARQMASWGRQCHCVGAANLLPKGTCGCRFSEWLKSQPGVVLDHKYIYETDRAYNLQPLDLQGALGLVQLGKLDAIHEARRVAHDRIEETLEALRWRKMAKSSRHITGVSELAEADPSWFGVPILCPHYLYKRAFVAHLEAAGIQTRNYFAGNCLLHPGYAHLGRAEDYPNANEVLKRVFFIGCHPMLTEAHFAHIEATIKAFVPPVS